MYGKSTDYQFDVKQMQPPETEIMYIFQNQFEEVWENIATKLISYSAHGTPNFPNLLCCKVIFSFWYNKHTALFLQIRFTGK